jgi:hypothetical protein
MARQVKRLHQSHLLGVSRLALRRRTRQASYTRTRSSRCGSRVWIAGRALERCALLRPCLTCFLLTPLAAKSKIKVQEVAIRPRAHRFTRFVSRISIPGQDTSICWLLRATLRDGSTFAIDVCNAQYAGNTTEDSGCGVFPWGPYMERLSASQGNVVSEQALEFCSTVVYNYSMTGNLGDVRAGRLTVADKRSLSEFMVSKATSSSHRTLPRDKGGVKLTLDKILRLPSSGYDEGVKTFRVCNQKCLDLIANTLGNGGAQMLIMGRFAGGTWPGGPGP